jgi:hypothetical protein
VPAPLGRRILSVDKRAGHIIGVNPQWVPQRPPPELQVQVLRATEGGLSLQ